MKPAQLPVEDVGLRGHGDWLELKGGAAAIRRWRSRPQCDLHAVSHTRAAAPVGDVARSEYPLSRSDLALTSLRRDSHRTRVPVLQSPRTPNDLKNLRGINVRDTRKSRPSRALRSNVCTCPGIPQTALTTVRSNLSFPLPRGRAGCSKPPARRCGSTQSGPPRSIAMVLGRHARTRAHVSGPLRAALAAFDGWRLFENQGDP